MIQYWNLRVCSKYVFLKLTHLKIVCSRKSGLIRTLSDRFTRCTVNFRVSIKVWWKNLKVVLKYICFLFYKKSEKSSFLNDNKLLNQEFTVQIWNFRFSIQVKIKECSTSENKLWRIFHFLVKMNGVVNKVSRIV